MTASVTGDTVLPSDADDGEDAATAANTQVTPPSIVEELVNDAEAPYRARRWPGVRRFNRHLLSMRIVLNSLLVLAVLYTVALTSALLIPLVLAAFLALGLNPIVATAARMHIPRALAALVIMLALFGGLTAGVNALIPPAAEWLHRAPVALRHIEPKLKPVTEQIDAASRATQSLVGNQAHTRASAQAEQKLFTTWDVLQMAPRILASVLAVGLLVFFFLIYGDALLRRLVEITPTFAQKRHNVEIVRSIQTEISRYLLTTTVINFTLGTLTAAWLWWMKMPDPLLWGVAVALANYVPYVGAITMTAVLAVVGLLNFHDAVQGILPALGFISLTAVEGNLITPLILGRRLRLSPVAILIWLLIWGWMWGIPGALLAVPMLTCAKLIAERAPGWEWFAKMVER